MKAKNTSIAALIFILLSAVSAYLASAIERDFGNIDVSNIVFMTEEMKPMSAKLYRPISATPDSPKPGVLALHGYQSDKEATNTFGALELAKRGFVVLAIDHFGHGFSTGLPASNSNMSGANNGYQYLKQLDFVDKDKLGIFGHSTGALNAIRVAKLNPDHKAINGLSSNGGEAGLNNYLLTQGLYEEIGGYRERTFPVKDLVSHPKRLEAFGLAENERLQWNHTYGNIEDGSARRAALVNGTHLGVMIASQSNKEIVSWFNQTLQQGDQSGHWPEINRQSYWYKEFAGLFSLFFALMALLCAANSLLKTGYFSAIRKQPTLQTAISKRSWWKFSLINIAVTTLFYPLFTQWGGPNEPIAALLPFMPLEMGNGIILWLLVSGIFSLILFLIWQRKSFISLSEFGVVSASASIKTAEIVWRSFVLSLICVGGLYLFTCIIYQCLHVELRFLWPLLKPLTAERFAILFFYWLPILFFFIVFSGLIISVQMRTEMRSSFSATLFAWSLQTLFFVIGGLLLLWIFHFGLNFLQIGPGFDVIGLPQFGGRWMMMLAVIIPQFIVFTVINHWCYLKTGYIYLGPLLTSMLMAWVLVGGQVMGRFLA